MVSSDHDAVAAGEASRQMLSTEDPPHPPCSSNIPELTGDGRAAKTLAFQEAADLVKVAAPDYEIKHQAPFSIRAYVFAARSKDIGLNWPFPQHLLQLCSKHGVKDLLPPLEHPQLVGAQHCGEELVPNQPVALVDTEKISQEVDLIEEDSCLLHLKPNDSNKTSFQSPLAKVVEEEKVGLLDLKLNDSKYVSCPPFAKLSLESLDCARSPLSEVGNLAAERGEEKLCGISKLLFPNEDGGEETAPEVPPLEFNAVKPPQASNTTENLCESSGKKRRLIVKFSGNRDSGRAVENVLNSNIAMESMSSKVCPVCKTFSSTSNTTLNAHIDQCLAPDSTSNSTKLNKQKVKATKKRLMADIYLTAPHCTLEDLERRNCTNWAVGSVFPMENGKVHTENKRQQMIQVNCNGDGEESAVYVDSNGMKLRILSKLNDSPVLTALENCNPNRNIKGSEEDKSFLLNKKKHLALTASKCLNVRPQRKKLLSSNGKIRKTPDGKYDVEKNYDKEECLSQLLKARNSFGGSRSGTLRQWVCSRRMRLSKKLNKITGHGANEDPLLVAQKLFQRRRSNSGNYSFGRSHIHKLSRFSVNSDASPAIQSKIGNLPDEVIFPKPLKSNSNQKINRPSFLADGNNEIFSRYLEHNISSTRSKRVEIDTSSAKRSPNFSDSFPSSTKAQKSTTSKNTLSGASLPSVEVNKCNKNRKLSLSNMSGKLNFRRPRKERCMVKMRDQVGECPINEEKGIDRMQASTEISGSANSVLVTETEEFASAVFLGRYKVPKSRDLKEDKSERITSENECSELEEHVDSEAGFGLHQYMSSGICPIKTWNQKFSAEDVTLSADTGITTSGQSYTSFSFGVEHVGPIFETKAWVERITPRSCDDQEMHCTECGGEGGTSSQMMSEVDYLLEGDSSGDQYMGCGTEPISIQEPGDGGLDALLEKLLVTSSGPGSIYNYQHELVNRDPSESPISTTCTLSPPPMGSSQSSFSGMKLSDDSAKPSLLDAFGSGPGSSIAFLAVETTKSERRNTEVTISPGKEPAKISDYEPCCFSRKGSANWGPVPVYQESAKLMQMTFNQNIAPENFSSSMTHQSLRAVEKAYLASGMLMGPICIKESLDNAVKSLNCTGIGMAGSMNQPTSSSMLRLMGQNLMVANNDEDESSQMGSAENKRPNERNVTCEGSCIGNISGQDTFPSDLPQDSNVEFSNSFRNCSNSKVSPTPPSLPFIHQDRLCMGGLLVSGYAAVKR